MARFARTHGADRFAPKNPNEKGIQILHKRRTEHIPYEMYGEQTPTADTKHHGRSEHKHGIPCRISTARTAARPYPDSLGRGHPRISGDWRSIGLHWSWRGLCDKCCQRRRREPVCSSPAVCETSTRIDGATCPTALGLARTASWTRRPLVRTQCSRTEPSAAAAQRSVSRPNCTENQTNCFGDRARRLCLSPYRRDTWYSSTLIRQRFITRQCSLTCSRTRGRKARRDR